jgi:hypothetical protein
VVGPLSYLMAFLVYFFSFPGKDDVTKRLGPFDIRKVLETQKYEEKK